MLIEFSVGNFLSFKERVTLSMVAARQLHARDPQVDENNTHRISEALTLLVTAPVYGANASGKSNLVTALGRMRQLILESSKESQSGELIDVKPFQLSPETEKAPSFFEIVFLLEGLQYRYGFELTRERVVAEWLFYVPSTKEAKLFTRDEDGIEVSTRFKEGRGLESKTRSNVLFLSLVAQFNGPMAQSVLQWFRRLGLVSGLDDAAYRNETVTKFIMGEDRARMIQLVKEFDLGIDDMVVDASDKSERSNAIRSLIKSVSLDEYHPRLVQKTLDGGIRTQHVQWDLDGKPVGQVAFDLTQESDGTQKLFFLTGPILSALAEGTVLVIDEMEARLHPLITQKLVRLFQSAESNPKRAQLIFTTHNTNLLSKQLFRRDQIWFVEKDQYGSSHLYSLAELKVRNDASFESDYIQGRYGAIPLLGSIRHVVVSEE